MRKNLMRLFVVAVGVGGFAALPLVAASAAPPAPSSAHIELAQGTDPELGTPVAWATYTYSGFHGKVVAHVTTYQNAVPVMTITGMLYPGKSGDLMAMVPIQASASANTWYATGYLTYGHSGQVIAGSEQTSATSTWNFEAVPCGP